MSTVKFYQDKLLSCFLKQPKAFEQAAGFLRIREAKNPLDNTAVHPERYALVEEMAADLGCSVQDLVRDKEQRASLDLKKYVRGDVGLPTLKDILKETLKQPKFY